MNRRGFALLAVLWMLTALSAVAAVALLVARTGATTTWNRVLLARAAWGREACAEILLARYAEEPRVRTLDTVDLGRGTWCAARLEDSEAKVNVNRVAPNVLQRVLRAVISDTVIADSLCDAIVTRRRHVLFADVAELGFDPSDDSIVTRNLSGVLTTRGLGAVDVNAAPPVVLRSLPGLDDEAVTVLLNRREAGQPVPSVDTLLSLLSPSAQDTLLNAYHDFALSVTFAPTQLLGTILGGVRGTPIRARVVITFVPAPGRLAVIRRETE